MSLSLSLFCIPGLLCNMSMWDVYPTPKKEIGRT
jgi:hypothetical protein